MKRLTIAAVLIVTALVQVCLAAVTVDNSARASTGAPGTPQTLSSFTVANQADRILLGGFAHLSNAGANTFTFNGDALTAEDGANIVQGGFTTSGIWYRLAPDVATGDAVVGFSGTPDASGICALSLYGVSQSSPLRDVDETSGETTSGTLTLTTVAGDIVFYAIYVYESTGGGLNALDHTAGSATGETEIGGADVSTDATNTTRLGCSYATAAGASTQIGYSWGETARFALVAVAVAPSSTAITINVPRRRR